MLHQSLSCLGQQALKSHGRTGTLEDATDYCRISIKQQEYHPSIHNRTSTTSLNPRFLDQSADLGIQNSHLPFSKSWQVDHLTFLLVTGDVEGVLKFLGNGNVEADHDRVAGQHGQHGQRGAGDIRHGTVSGKNDQFCGSKRA